MAAVVSLNFRQGHTPARYHLVRISRVNLESAVTRGTLFRCRLIEQHGLSIHLLKQLVTPFALHIAVYALERKARSPSVVEERRPPLRRVMAVCAGC